jgi:antirestriction protein ArdC
LNLKDNPLDETKIINLAKMSKQQAIDKFELITNQLILLIEQGIKPWERPWHTTPYQNLLTGHKYSGINPIICSVDSLIYDYEQPFFVGFNQAKQQGWKIKKGSKSTWIRWGGTYSKETENPDTGEIKKEFIQGFKWQNIFNVACIDDRESDLKVRERIKELTSNQGGNKEPRIQEIEALIERHNPTTKFGGNLACYQPSTDTISLPKYENFSKAIAYYSSYLHELVHWTSSDKRCHRTLNHKFGSSAYAFEELIAEIGAAMLCNELGIDSQLEHHASYLENWLSILKGDKKAFFQAAQKASEAANYLLENQEIQEVS